MAWSQGSDTMACPTPSPSFAWHTCWSLGSTTGTPCWPGMPASATAWEKSTGLASTLNQVPSWKAVLHHSTCATTCWSSPEASLPSSLATGSCRRYVATVLCQMASCSREGLGVDIGLVFSSCPVQKESRSVSYSTASSGASTPAGHHMACNLTCQQIPVPIQLQQRNESTSRHQCWRKD